LLAAAAGPFLVAIGNLQTDAVNVLTIRGKVHPHKHIHLLLIRLQLDVGESEDCCLVQPAVGPGSAAQAAGVASTAAQHSQQTGVWQLQERCCSTLSQVFAFI
jgi:hypothetical protein